jgi:CRP-like cAMP-binding protein
MDWQDWAGNACYALLAVSYLVTNMWWLRLLAVISLFFEGVYFYFGASEPLWVGIVWNVVFVLINIINLYFLTHERLKSRVDRESQELLAGPFLGIARLPFCRLIRAGRWRNVHNETELTVEGEPVQDLMVIGSGSVEVLVGGKRVAVLQAGHFIGEMSLLTRGNATATVKAVGECRLFTVRKTALADLLAKDKELDAALHGVLSRDLVQKLLQHRLDGAPI